MSQGITLVYVLAEDYGGATPTQQDLQQYANQYGMNSVMIVADPNWQLRNHFEIDAFLPTVALVKYDGTILVKDDVDAFNNNLVNAAPPYGGP